MSSDKKLNKVIEKELKEIRHQYGDERRTVIEEEIEAIEVDISVTVPSEDVIVTLSEDMYIKRVSLRSFTSSGGTLGTSGMKEGDRIKHFIRINTIHSLLLFTNDGMYFQLPVHEIPDVRWKDPGTALVNVVALGKEQKIIGVIPVDDFSKESYLHFVTSKGMIKKTALSEYSTNHRKRAIAAIKVKNEDHVIQVFMGQDNDNMLLVTKEGMAIQFALQEVNPMGRNTAGTKAIRLGDGDEVLSANATREEDDRILSILTTEGVGKRIYLSDFILQARGGKGMLTIRRRKTHPHRLIYAIIEEEPSIVSVAITNKAREIVVDFSTISISDQGSSGKELVPVNKGEEIVRVYQTPVIDGKTVEESDIS